MFCSGFFFFFLYYVNNDSRRGLLWTMAGLANAHPPARSVISKAAYLKILSQTFAFSVRGGADWLYHWCYLEEDDVPVQQQQTSADRNDSNEMLGDRALGEGEEKYGASERPHSGSWGERQMVMKQDWLLRHDKLQERRIRNQASEISMPDLRRLPRILYWEDTNEWGW